MSRDRGGAGITPAEPIELPNSGAGDDESEYGGEEEEEEEGGG